MARPTITVNSSTGSDTLSSGSGGTALNGSAAANSPTPDVAGNLIALDGSPDLSGVATDGTAVLRLDAFGSGGGFWPITAVDNTAKTVTIETNVRITTSVAWAIGGKLATITAATSRFLFGATTAGSATNTGIGGAGGGWTVIAEDDGALAITTSAITFSASGGDTNGKLTLKGDSESTRRVLNQSANNPHFNVSSSLRLVFENLHVTNTNGTKTSANGFAFGTSASYVFKNCIFGHATNTMRTACYRTGNTPIIYMYDCAVRYSTEDGLDFASGTVILYGCDISNNTGHGVQAATFTARNCIISHNTTNGVLASSTLQIDGCTIDQNGLHGAETSLANVTSTSYVINSIISGHSDASDSGVLFSGSTPHAPLMYNNIFNNNDTDCTGFTLDSSNQIDVNPAYTNSASGTRNYTPTNTALAGDALPSGMMGASQSASTSYRYPGAVQPASSASVGAIETGFIR